MISAYIASLLSRSNRVMVDLIDSRSSFVETYIALFSSSCLLTLLLTPSLREAAIENGILDHPNERKIHNSAVPRVGGIAIIISFFSSIALGYVLFRPQLSESMTYLAGLCISTVIIAITGIWDDLWTLNARKKLIGQITAALILIPFGFVIRSLNLPFVGTISIGWQIGIPLTVFWVVGIMNTINFIDGMDGLAAGVAVTIATALFIVSVINHEVLMAIVCLIVAGSALGFLRYNFHPASIFMGDCGAMFLGLALAAVSIKVFQNPSTTANSLVPVLIFGLPIADTTWAIIRRLRKWESPFHADSFHIHHRLIALGFTQKRVAIILYVASLVCVSAGLIITLTNNGILAIILSASILFAVLISIMILNRISPPIGTSERRKHADISLINSVMNGKMHSQTAFYVSSEIQRGRISDE